MIRTISHSTMRVPANITTILVRRLAPLAVVLALLPAAVSAEDDATTAKSALALAQEHARAWNEDAELTQVSTLTAGADGRSARRQWGYFFYSPEQERSLMVTVYEGTMRVMEVGSGPRAAIPEGIIDSDRAMRKAQAAGFGPQHQNIMLLGRIEGDGIETGIYWCVARPQDMVERERETATCVDPRSGDFVAELEAGS